jgi:deoxycytidylate deaminase
MARPCQSCMAAIKDLGIKEIYYTSDEGFVYEKLKSNKGSVA